MKILSKIRYRYLFKAFCIVCLLCMVGYWFYKFIVEDRDIGTVDYRSFKNDSNVKYPVASLCFAEPFVDGKVAEHYPDLNTTNYMAYLEGDGFDETFTHVNYFNITFDLDDYFKHTLVFLRNKTELVGSKIITFSHKVSFSGVSEWYDFYKCIELSWETTRPDLIKEIFVV